LEKKYWKEKKHKSDISFFLFYFFQRLILFFKNFFSLLADLKVCINIESKIFIQAVFFKGNFQKASALFFARLCRMQKS